MRPNDNTEIFIWIFTIQKLTLDISLSPLIQRNISRNIFSDQEKPEILNVLVENLYLETGGFR